MKKDKPATTAATTPIGDGTATQTEPATQLNPDAPPPTDDPPPAPSASGETPPAEEERPDVLAPDEPLIGGSWVRQKDGSLVRSIQED